MTNIIVKTIDLGTLNPDLHWAGRNEILRNSPVAEASIPVIHAIQKIVASD